jgi:hypothetical protein
MSPFSIDPLSRCQLEQIATRFCHLGPRALADYLTQIANPITVVTLLDVADDYYGWVPDPETMRAIGADRFSPKLWVVPSDLGEDGP